MRLFTLLRLSPPQTRLAPAGVVGRSEVEEFVVPVEHGENVGPGAAREAVALGAAGEAVSQPANTAERADGGSSLVPSPLTGEG